MLPIHREFLRAFDRLTCAERESVGRTLSMLESGQVTGGMRPHKVGPWLSLSANMDLRIIAAGSPHRPTLVYVGHHDAAYDWAARRTPGITVAGVEILPVSNLIPAQARAAEEEAAPLPVVLARLAARVTDPTRLIDYLVELSPEWQEWMARVYLDGETPRPPVPEGSSLVWVADGDTPTAEALAGSRREWQIFLHPTQQQAVQDTSSRSIAITGGPGTGKTVALLRRLFDRAPAAGTRRVLLAYTEGLVDDLRTTMAELNVDTSTRVVLPTYFLSGPAPAKARYARRLPGVRLTLRNGAVWLTGKHGEAHPVDELLVDEFQDLDDETIETLAEIAGAGRTRVVVAADVNQSIHRANADLVDAFLTNCAGVYRLGLCYRSSRQILRAAAAVEERLRPAFDLPAHRADGAQSRVLAGPPVRFVCADDLSSQVAECVRVMDDLERRYDRRDLALVYVQYYNPSFKGGSREEAALKNSARLGKHYRFASLTKGREYLAGVLFISESFMGREMGPRAMRLRANTLYVALTRFRDEVTVVYPRSCSIAHALLAVDDPLSSVHDHP